MAAGGEAEGTGDAEVVEGETGALGGGQESTPTRPKRRYGMASSLAALLRLPAPTTPSRSDSLFRRLAPWMWVSGVSVFNLWDLRAESKPVAFLNDASVHEQMARFAAQRISEGHLPFTSWFPYISLGSAQYLHYQSLGSVLAGLAGLVVGTNTAFSWSTYLLLSLWPFVIYSSARLFGLPRYASAAAAVLAPFMVSFTGVGYERGAYIWIGGAQVWTQLVGSWALPFAWAFTWKALQRPRWAWAACSLVAITTALHFLSGYLAFMGIVVIAAVCPGRFVVRAWRAVLIFAGSVAAAAWVVVPLVQLSNWSAINQELSTTEYVRGYGAATEIGWLFGGQMFDARRSVPVITAAVFLGAVVVLLGWRWDAVGRALMILFVGSLLLSFGPTTWGSLADLVPAHADLYFRRFMMGCQLAGIYMAGIGAYAAWSWARLLAASLIERTAPRRVAMAVVVVAGVVWCWPAVSEIANLDHRDSDTIAAQQEADVSDGAALTPILSYIKRHGGGRTYAGLGSNWGQSFTVGFVPMYKYLESQDIDENTYVVPSLSLMLDPEASFDENNPADFNIFGTTYLLLPYGMSPPVPARRVMVSGLFALWVIPTSGYASVVNIEGMLQADRADIGSQSTAFLAEVGMNEDFAVKWPGLAAPAAPPGGYGGQPSGLNSVTPAPGRVTSVVNHLSDGEISISVVMHRPGSVLASVAFDPAWKAWANGKPVPTEMLAPAVLGVALGPGHYHIVLKYQGYQWYPELWVIGLFGLAAVAWVGRRIEPA